MHLNFKLGLIFIVFIEALLIGYLLYKQYYITQAYESEHPVVVVDWTEIANPSSWRNATQTQEAIDATYAVIEDLKKAGYIVIDGRAVNAAPQESLINAERIKQRLASQE